MNQTTQLASGQINGQDQLQVLLVKPMRPGRPALVQLIWPARPTVIAASEYPTTAATVMRLLAEASVTLAATRLYKK
jgi:hypothetical protein